MKELIISKKNNEKKLINVILSLYPTLSINTLNKAIRKKDIKVNANRITSNVIVFEGDVIQIYIPDQYFNITPTFNIKDMIVYEDEQILVLNKPSNICILKDKKDEICIMDLIQDLNEYRYIQPGHRLDRNTSGLIVFAKTKDALDELLCCFKNRLIDKYYKCLVYGILREKSDILTSYLFKDSVKSQVIISDKKLPYYELIQTNYKVIEEYPDKNLSLLEVNLITGKTHQIRAHLAHIGHPIIGDGKYGINKINKQFNRKYQCLASYKIVFHTKDLKTLKYLDNKVIEINKNNFKIND